MASEAIEGEEKLTDSFEKSHNLRFILGLEKNPPQKRTKGSAQDSDQQRHQTRKNIKPFKRLPKRDAVGEQSV